MCGRATRSVRCKAEPSNEDGDTYLSIASNRLIRATTSRHIQIEHAVVKLNSLLQRLFFFFNLNHSLGSVRKVRPKKFLANRKCTDAVSEHLSDCIRFRFMHFRCWLRSGFLGSSTCNKKTERKQHQAHGESIETLKNHSISHSKFVERVSDSGILQTQTT